MKKSVRLTLVTLVAVAVGGLTWTIHENGSFKSNNLTSRSEAQATVVSDFNRSRHPERHTDEVFITNAGDFGFQEVGWETKRRGVTSYDIQGKPLGARWLGSFPVFAKKAEVAVKIPDLIAQMTP